MPGPGGEATERVMRTVFLPTQNADMLLLKIESLTAQLGEQKQLTAERVGALLEDRRIRAQARLRCASLAAACRARLASACLPRSRCAAAAALHAAASRRCADGIGGIDGNSPLARCGAASPLPSLLAAAAAAASLLNPSSPPPLTHRLDNGKSRRRRRTART